MDDKSKKCYACRYFDRYYVKEVKRFKKIKFGWCCNCGKAVSSCDGCDKFVFRKPKKIDEGMLKFYLSDLLTEISELRQAVEAEINGNEEL